MKMVIDRMVFTIARLILLSCLTLFVINIQAQQSLQPLASIEHDKFPCCISGMEKKSDSTYYLVSDYRSMVYVAFFNKDTKHMILTDSVSTNLKVKSSFESVRLFDHGRKLMVVVEGDTLNRRANAKLLSSVLSTEQLSFQKMPISDSYLNMPYNSGIESMSLSHDGKSLWLANERPYDIGKFKGKVIFERYAITNTSLKLKESIEYSLDPELTGAAKVDNGVTEILVYNADSMLVMERAYDIFKQKVSVRIFWFNNRTKVKNLKTLFVADSLVKQGFVPTVDNYEGMCFGPDHEGKKTIFIISDDNANWNYDRRTMIPRQRTDIIWLKIQ